MYMKVAVCLLVIMAFQATIILGSPIPDDGWREVGQHIVKKLGDDLADQLGDWFGRQLDG
ncbi:hypothetical protein C0J52_22715 [Blattella germanica]|nr:hypothetical protein C0J52_22715 [Blattella germanica]